MMLPVRYNTSADEIKRVSGLCAIPGINFVPRLFFPTQSESIMQLVKRDAVTETGLTVF